MTRFIIRTKTGQPLGRETFNDDLGPVPEAFAYVYDDQEQAERIAAQHPGSTVETYGVVSALPLAASEEELADNAKALLDRAGTNALTEAQRIIQDLEDREVQLPPGHAEFLIAMAPHLGRAGGRAIILQVMRETRST